MPPDSNAPGVINPIQYLRGLAAMMVVWQHTAGETHALGSLSTSDLGASGVHVFFVVSGFIMTVTTFGRVIDPADFMLRRIIRVVPLYWLATVLMLIVALIAPGAFNTLRFSVTTVILSLFFVPHDSLSFPGSIWPVLVPGWTLNYEMFFYALFAVCLALPVRRRVPAIAVVLGLLVLIGIEWGPFTSPLARVYTNHVLCEFVTGAVIGQVWMAGKLPQNLAVSAAALVVGFALLFVPSGGHFDLTQIVGATLMVGGCLHPVMRASQRALPLRLGDASYSIYLSHLFTLGILRVLWSQMFSTNTVASDLAYLAVSLSTCAAIGWLVHRCVERPMTRRLSRWLTSPPPAAAACTPHGRPAGSLPGGR